MNRIYLDYAASTPMDPRVARAMQPYFSEKFGNPGSLHSFGQEAIAAIDKSRETIAHAVRADFREIVFTGSATEANNLAIHAALKSFKGKYPNIVPKIIVSTIEHESVLETARDMERYGVEVVLINSEKLEASLDDRAALVSLMYANNETGLVQPIAEIAKTAKRFRSGKNFPVFHTDAAQAFQFLDCNVNELGVDMMTLSGHKIYGPKGVGALYIRKGGAASPDTTGGGQEFGLRSGTENVPSIVGFAKAIELILVSRDREAKRIKTLRDHFAKQIKKIFPKAEFNSGFAAATLPNILNVYFPGHSAEDMLTMLDLKGVAASAGSACHSRAMEVSYVLQALGHSKERAKSSIRFSLGRPTTKAEIEKALRALAVSLRD